MFGFKGINVKQTQGNHSYDQLYTSHYEREKPNGRKGGREVIVARNFANSSRCVITNTLRTQNYPRVTSVLFSRGKNDKKKISLV